MSKLRILVNHQGERTGRRKFRYLTEGNQTTPKAQSPQINLKKLKGIYSLSIPKDKGNVETSQQLKDKLYHKNFSQYKQIFEAESNVQTLPFILTLRKSKQQKYDANAVELTGVEPFEVALKPTLNQKIKKDVSDIGATRARAYQASYRWRKRSGADVRASCEFQTGLRESNEKKSLEQSKFLNYIKPMRYKDIQSKRYNLKELICEHQKRIFTTDADK